MTLVWFILGMIIGIVLVWILKSGDVRNVNLRLSDAMSRLDDCRRELDIERSRARRAIDENNSQWQTRLDAVKDELLRTQADALAERQASLQAANRMQMKDLLQPIQQKFAEFQQALEADRRQNEVDKRALQASFESTLKLFAQQQDHAVGRLVDATERIGDEASNLTRALKSDTKRQGNWGEMVLETLLENSGLRRDEEYYVQREYKDGKGRSAYPDVVVRFPEGRCVVIDSKVSLTAYAESVAAEDEKERTCLLREHVKSVRRHVDELAERDYTHIVDQAIGYVLMFIPNESAYIAAVKQDPSLSTDAYAQRIIVISPSNLLMALQLAYNLWQYDRQGKNVEKIIATAADLYDKVVGFEDAFMEIDMRLNQVRTAFDTARGRLYTGRGSVMGRVSTLKELGVTPKKRLKGDTSESDTSDGSDKLYDCD